MRSFLMIYWVLSQTLKDLPEERWSYSKHHCTLFVYRITTVEYVPYNRCIWGNTSSCTCWPNT